MLNKLLLLILGVTVTVGCVSFMDRSVGVKSVTSQILAATTQEDKFPAIIKLSKDGRIFCSGSVITDTLVLTAAHCVARYSMMTGTEILTDFNIESLEKGDIHMISPSKVIGVNLRQDTALVQGDFRRYSKLKIQTDPNRDILVVQPSLVSCGFPNGGRIVCYTAKHPYKYIDMIGADGQMYAGMSGGPVMDLNTQVVYAVNHAVGPDIVIFAPIINLFEGISKVD